ncbi:MAG: hypothetical protein GWN18_01025, partial [Thermoplasmata archaeon]|nr:hypothetical protein [Thermoplasmata archaeon]NIS10582.1 hypothetical protein [Thermoplasmata archaeon]NIS18544.1 hypothetical protein [Thermoplasmata archaeon]NIT75530.1 hypothetical protein [Thermoplasmata archaeon]NIU47697.1 hypothetical protein [Thermoplasmata archaeon]
MYFDIRIMHTRQLLCMPVLLVGPNMGEHRVGNLSVWVNPNWAPGRTMSIDPNEGYHYVWLDERDGDPGRQWQMFHDERTEMGERAGELETGLYVYSEYASVGDLYINVSVDGEQIDHFKLNETGRNWTADTIDWVTVDTIVPPGPHNLTFTGGINASAWNITWELDERTLQVYRYTGSEDAEELAAWLVSNRYTILMVDPGVRLDGLSCTVGTMDYYFSMSILTWDGSQVVIDELSFQEGAWGQLVTSGNGTYWINNLTAFWIDHEVRNCTVTMGSPDIVVYFPSLNNGDLYICGTFDNSDLFLEAVNGSLFVMDGVDVDMDEYGSLLAIGSDVVLRDCRFVSQHETAIRMNGRVWANFTVDSCEFVG